MGKEGGFQIMAFELVERRATGWLFRAVWRWVVEGGKLGYIHLMISSNFALYFSGDKSPFASCSIFNLSIGVNIGLVFSVVAAGRRAFIASSKKVDCPLAVSFNSDIASLFIALTSATWDFAASFWSDHASLMSSRCFS